MDGESNTYSGNIIYSNVGLDQVILVLIKDQHRLTMNGLQSVVGYNKSGSYI